MKHRIDMHVHSKFSGDSDAEPEDFIERAIEAGLDGIAFTEHYYYEASEPIEVLVEKYRGDLIIFRGVELSSAEGHCLVLGVNTDKLRLSHAPFEEVTRVVNESKGVVIPSHPYRRGHGLGDTIRGVDGICAIEGYNGYNMSSYNEKAIEIARELQLPYTGGSDAHLSREIGMCYTEFDTEVTRDNLIDILKEGYYRGIDTRSISSGVGSGQY
jgi:predicted metal-dependent phosphoesterase TrpH